MGLRLIRSFRSFPAGAHFSVVKILAVLCALWLTVAPTPVSAQVVALRFQNVTGHAGINTTAPDWGFSAVGDIDGDGWDDLLLNFHPGVHFYKNSRDGTFIRVIPGGIPPASEATKHRHIFAFCDIDADGKEDLIIGTGIRGPDDVDPHQQPRSSEDLWLKNVSTPAAAGVPGVFAFQDMTAAWGTKNLGSNVTAIGCFDADNDGKLDVLMMESQTFDRAWDATFPHYGLYLNRLPVGFVKEPSRMHLEPGSGVIPRETIVTYSVDCADLIRGDRAQDCIVGANQHTRWVVQGFDPYRDPLYFPANGTFYVSQGDEVPQHLASLGSYNFEVAVADFNGDGRLDIARADYNAVGLIVQCGNTAGGGAPTRVCYSRILGERRKGRIEALALGDFDNDGDVDIFATVFGEQSREGRQIDAPDMFFRNNGPDARGNPRFTQMAASVGLAGPFVGNFETGAGTASVIDYDLDGRLDLVIGYTEGSQFEEHRRPILLYRNVSTGGNAWIGLKLRPVGIASLGAKVDARIQGGVWRTSFLTPRTGWLSQDSRNVHIGLGPVTSLAGPVEVRITWPNGAVQTVALPAGAYHTVQRP